MSLDTRAKLLAVFFVAVFAYVLPIAQSAHAQGRPAGETIVHIGKYPTPRLIISMVREGLGEKSARKYLTVLDPTRFNSKTNGYQCNNRADRLMIIVRRMLEIEPKTDASGKTLTPSYLLIIQKEVGVESKTFSKILDTLEINPTVLNETLKDGDSTFLFKARVDNQLKEEDLSGGLDLKLLECDFLTQ